MAQNLKKISGSKVQFTLTIVEEVVEKSKKKAIEEFRHLVETKGFRKGSAPDEVVIETLGAERIWFEGLNKAIDKEYKDFIRENDLKPVNAPELKISDTKKFPISVQIEVEVFPEVNLGNYKKIKMSPLKVELGEKEIDSVIENIMQEAGLRKVVQRTAQKGDSVEVDFAGKDEKGEVIPNTKAEKFVFTLGQGRFLEDLEKAYEGMKAGEEKKAVKVRFPKEYHSKDLAGKTVNFDIKMQSVGEISAKNLDEAGVEKIVGKKKKLDEFKKEVEDMVRLHKTDGEKKKHIAEYNQQLIKMVKIDLPPSWITKEVELRMEGVKNSPQYTHDPEAFWKMAKTTEEALKKQFNKEAVENLTVFIALTEIVKQEGIELDKDEVAKAHHVLQHKVNKDTPEAQAEEELQRILLGMQIDKYMQGLML